MNFIVFYIVILFPNTTTLKKRTTRIADARDALSKEDPA